MREGRGQFAAGSKLPSALAPPRSALRGCALSTLPAEHAAGRPRHAGRQPSTPPAALDTPALALHSLTVAAARIAAKTGRRPGPALDLDAARIGPSTPPTTCRRPEHAADDQPPARAARPPAPGVTIHATAGKHRAGQLRKSGQLNAGPRLQGERRPGVGIRAACGP
jgi:hypothetical protein